MRARQVRRREEAQGTRRSRTPERHAGGRATSRWVGVVSCLVYLFLIAPLFIILVISFTSSNYLTFPPPSFSLRWYDKLINNERLLDSAYLSLRIALLVTAASGVLGTLVALGLARRQIFFRAGFRAIFLAPLIVPYIILALGLFYVNLKLGLRGSVASIVVAHTVAALPFVVVLVSSALYGVPRNLQDAACGLGADSLTVFRRITLPLIAPSIAGAAIIAFIVSWDEFILAFLLSTPRLYTLPVVIFGLLRERMEPTVAPMSVILMSITLAAVAISEALRRRAQSRYAQGRSR